MDRETLPIMDRETLPILDRPREEDPSLDTKTEVKSGQSDTESSDKIGANATSHSIDSMVAQVQEAMTTAAKPKPKAKAKARAKGKKASTATKKTPPTAPCPIIKRPAGNFKAFPGVPNKPTPPRDLGNGMKLYTDLGSGAWRVKCKGQTKWRTFTWKTDAKKAWGKLSNFVSKLD